MAVRVREDACDERLKFAGVFFRGAREVRRAGADERADATTRLEHAGSLEVDVDARDGVCVHFELDGELADGGQLVPGAKPPSGDGGAEAVLDLSVDRRGIAGINRENGHLIYNTSSLVQSGQEKGWKPEPLAASPWPLAPSE